MDLVLFMLNYGKNICVIKNNWSQTFVIVIFRLQNYYYLDTPLDGAHSLGKFESLGNFSELH